MTSPYELYGQHQVAITIGGGNLHVFNNLDTVGGPEDFSLEYQINSYKGPWSGAPGTDYAYGVDSSDWFQQTQAESSQGYAFRAFLYPNQGYLSLSFSVPVINASIGLPESPTVAQWLEIYPGRSDEPTAAGASVYTFDQTIVPWIVRYADSNNLLDEGAIAPVGGWDMVLASATDRGLTPQPGNVENFLDPNLYYLRWSHTVQNLSPTSPWTTLFWAIAGAAGDGFTLVVGDGTDFNPGGNIPTGEPEPEEPTIPVPPITPPQLPPLAYLYPPTNDQDTLIFPDSKDPPESGLGPWIVSELEDGWSKALLTEYMRMELGNEFTYRDALQEAQIPDIWEAAAGWRETAERWNNSMEKYMVYGLVGAIELPVKGAEWFGYAWKQAGAGTQIKNYTDVVASSMEVYNELNPDDWPDYEALPTVIRAFGHFIQTETGGKFVYAAALLYLTGRLGFSGALSKKIGLPIAAFLGGATVKALTTTGKSIFRDVFGGEGDTGDIPAEALEEGFRNFHSAVRPWAEKLAGPDGTMEALRFVGSPAWLERRRR